MPTVVGILTFINRENSAIRSSEPEKNAEFLDIYILMRIQKFMLSRVEHEKKV